mgnify:CR=1 FL=1|jgi:hypothetical protein
MYELLVYRNGKLQFKLYSKALKYLHKVLSKDNEIGTYEQMYSVMRLYRQWITVINGDTYVIRSVNHEEK